MIKKLSSKKGSSTLTIAVLVIIILSTLAILTTLIIGRNAEISTNQVHRKYNMVLLENALYDEINNICLNKEAIEDSSYTTDKGYNVTLSNSGTIEITDGKYKVIATVQFDFTSDSYKVLKWGRENA